jgi:hypothetical protein
MGIAKKKKRLDKRKTHTEEEVERKPSHTLEDACENWYVHRHGKVMFLICFQAHR